MKKIAILGCTGSIGKQTLEVIDHLGWTGSVVAIAAGSQKELIQAQAMKYNPSLVALYDEKSAVELSKELPHTEVLGGMEGLEAVASHPDVEIVISAITGSIGLKPTLAAIEAGKKIALANKETLVSAGDLVMKKAHEKKVTILPVDSEHSALFQCLQGNRSKEVDRLILTASGGPFRNTPLSELETITPDLALAHPTWSMGPKVTIDSSTLMNKGLEVIEAHHLFQFSVDQLDVVIHPQSLIHSMVEYRDGSMMAQISKPDMRLPIQYALTYPDRREGLLDRFDFLANPKIEFFLPDTHKFRCLALAYEAIREGKSAPCFLNAANEVLVARFLAGELSWSGIGEGLDDLLTEHKPVPLNTLEDVHGLENEARQKARELRIYV